eukprot:scaffold229580_cov30-Prasinocladus_malaysianus.AAC.2
MWWCSEAGFQRGALSQFKCWLQTRLTGRSPQSQAIPDVIDEKTYSLALQQNVYIPTQVQHRASACRNRQAMPLKAPLTPLLVAAYLFVCCIPARPLGCTLKGTPCLFSA